MDPYVGKLIAGRFRIESVIGSGGLGTVYRANQEPLERPVAVKMLRHELSESQDLRRRFVREARAVAALSHPNIAMVHDFGIGRDRSLFMALEFVDGTPLADVFDDPNVDFATIAGLFDQILTGLAHAHARGIIHRDIKPANILVAQQEDGAPLVKIVDFGIAAVAGFSWEDDEPGATGKGQVSGTPQYMAPEQARGEKHVSATVDVYAVGLLLFRAVTGADAFDEGGPMDILMAQVSQPPPPIVIRPGLEVPNDLRRLILDALAKSPRERIPSAQVFRSRLRRLIGQRTSPGLPPLTPTPHVDAPTEADLRRAAPFPPTRADNHTAVEDAVVEKRNAPAVWSAARSIRGETPFVGREADVSRLADVVLEAIANANGIVAIVEGESGMGKTRVASAAREQLAEHHGFYTGQGTFHREGERGLRGIREVFDDLLGTRDLDASRVTEHIASRLDALNIPDPDSIRVISAFVRPTVDRSLPLAVAPDALFEILYRFLHAAAQAAPIAVTLDDVQWAGPETEAFLEFVATELQHRPAPFAIIATTHVGQAGANDSNVLRRLARFDGGTVFRHALYPLDAASARRLINSLLHADDALAEALIARSGGNPMHIVQFVRFLVDEGLLEKGPAGWRPKAQVDVNAVLPPSLADVMALRIEQLEQIVPGSRLRDLLNRCAVLGRNFRFGVLERMLHIENRSDLLDSIDADVDVLLDEEFLRMRPFGDDDILAFPSSLVRDALLERMKNRRTTRRLHAFAAEAKLAILGDEAEKIADELVKHFCEARDRPRELEYARIAADVAERNHRPHDAAAHLRRVITLLDDPEGEHHQSDSVGLRTSFTLRLGELRVGLGEYRDAEQDFNTVSREPRASASQRVLATFGRARVNRILGKLSEAREQYTEALRAARSLENAEILARGSLGLARVEWHAGNLELARSLAEDALELSQQPGAGRVRPEAVWLIGDVARSTGDNDAAITAFEEALEAFTAADLRKGIAKCYARLAVVRRSQGQFDVATEHYEHALKIYVGLGDRKGLAHQLNGLGDVARFRGEFARAADLYRRAVDIFQTLELPYDTALALTNLGLVAMDSRRFVDAESAFRRAAAVSERVGYAYLTIGIGLNLAHVLAQLGREEESSATLESSLALADASTLVDPDFARPLERLADAFALSGHDVEARQMLERAKAMWDELGRADDSSRIDARLSSLLEEPRAKAH